MKFAVLFSIRLRHEYAADGICRGLRVQPCAATQAMLKKMSAKLVSSPGKIIITAETNDEGKLRFEPAQPFAFRFWLIQEDDLFTNYTDLNLLGSKRIAVFINNVTTSGNEILLHSGNSAGDTQVADVVNVPAVLSKTTGNFKRIPTQSQHGITQNGDQLLVQPDTEDEGLYADETQQKKFYAARLPRAAVLGVIEIHHAENIPAASLLLDSDSNLRTPEYTIQFTARSSYWYYLLSGKVLPGFSGLVITDSERSIFFNGPEETKLFDGSPVYLFRSPQRFPLREKPSRIFQLRRNADTNGNAGTSVIDKLPAASADLIHLPRQPGNDEVISEIIVHL